MFDNNNLPKLCSKFDSPNSPSPNHHHPQHHNHQPHQQQYYQRYRQNKSKNVQDNSFLPLPVSAPTASTTIINYDLNQQHQSRYDPPIFNSMRSTNTNQIVSYIYELPYNVRKSICDLLGN